MIVQRKVLKMVEIDETKLEPYKPYILMRNDYWDHPYVVIFPIDFEDLIVVSKASKEEEN